MADGLSMIPAVTFEIALLSDAAEIAALVNSCYRGDESRRGWTTEADLLDGTRTDVDEVANLIEQPSSIILTCLDGQGLVGSVPLKRRGDSCHLGMLVVRPERQREGLGKLLLAVAEAYAIEYWACNSMRSS